MSWQQKALKNNIKEIFSSVPLYILTMVVLGLWSYFSGNSFSWIWVEPIEVPSIPVRLFYSALTFFTIGAFLYKIGFYKFLWSISSSWKDFKKSKKEIWGILMLLMFFVIVPKVVELLNAIASVFYNLFYFLLYVFPSFVISIMLVGAYFYLCNKQTRPTVLNTTSEKSL